MAVYTAALPASRSQFGSLAPVRVWLWSMAALVLLMVLVGGATRLLEAGLSMTEWRPVSGALPPLSTADWMTEFDKYKQIPQFAAYFPDMTLSGFQRIFYWEWGHRLLGRLIGLAFAGPLAWFWISGRLTRWLKPRLLAILALGALQGAVGWWMVASGLVGRVEVAPERLAVHLLLATLTLVAIIWLAVRITPAPAEPGVGGLRRPAAALIGLLVVQIGLGALVAGLRAGRAYNTWPLMDGGVAPPLDDLTRLAPLWRNVFENVALVQLDHRILAYAVVTLALWHAATTVRLLPQTSASRRAFAIAGLVLIQAALGITTLVLAVPVWAGLLHQTFAMITLAVASVHFARIQGACPAAPSAT